MDYDRFDDDAYESYDAYEHDDVVLRLPFREELTNDGRAGLPPGAVVLRYYRRGGVRVEIKPDQSPVTEADRAAAELLGRLYAEDERWRDAETVAIGGDPIADVPSAEDIVSGRQRLAAMMAALVNAQYAAAGG